MKKRVEQDPEGNWWCYYGTRRFRGVRRTCGSCGGEFFSPAHSVGKYCSNKCSAQARPKKGRWIESHGYVDLVMPRDHPFAKAMGRRRKTGNTLQVLEHRLVMAEALGRPLESHETVHHKNGDRRDNRLENLELRQGRHGKGVAHVCLDCGSHNVAARALG